ncbi:AAA family ATPase [Enterococcus sp. AZ126]|uniref:AAA family ATPase n=1 Tax=Enterococcus sp. AZ126 TaxID=2774635 RepID=UPI003F25D719
MKFEEIEIKNIGNISDLKLQFNPRMNVICGSNGVGKTTIINTLIAPFYIRNNQLKKKFGTTEGLLKVIYFENDNSAKSKETKVTISAIAPNEVTQTENQDLYNPRINNTANILYFSINRDIKYQSIQSLSRNPDMEQLAYQDEKNIQSIYLKTWLITKYLTSGREEDMEDYEVKNYELIKQVFNIIDSNKSFVKADYKTYEIIMNDRGNEVYFEYESAGFKAVLFILIGIISQIEFRFPNDKIVASEFEGVIIIDEIDLHLHPTWQNEIIRILKETFKKAQFILTTHSPSVLQALENDEIIPLEQSEDNEVRIKELNLSKYGLKGWTLEEILSDVMGVGKTKNNVYTETFEKFEKALDDGDDIVIKQTAIELKEMLHPISPLKQIIDIQMAGLIDD